jgi:3-oxoacyl-[acyl-carrier protein] reductase
VQTSGLRIPELTDKVVLITGASTGIGAALAGAFAAQGSKVRLRSRRTAAAWR